MSELLDYRVQADAGTVHAVTRPSGRYAPLVATPCGIALEARGDALAGAHGALASRYERTDLEITCRKCLASNLVRAL